MAAIFVDQGLDAITGIWPKNGTNDASTFLGFFTGLTGSTVPARSATSGASRVGWTEAAGTNYARQSIAAASWGANSTDGNGRATQAAQVTFPTVGTGGWGTLDGVVQTRLGDVGAGDVAFFFSNFTDLTSIVTTENDIVRVTPTVIMDGQ